jgi:hypothetical protein
MSAPSPSLRKLFAELEQLFQSETEARVSSSVQEAQRALAEHLNQAVRRLRQAVGFEEVAAILADACAPFCNGCAVFHVMGNEVRGAAGSSELRLDAGQAAAFAAAIASREPVTALCSASQVSTVLIDRFHHEPDDKAHLFPLTVRRSTVGVLYAGGAVESAALELLVQSAGAVLEGQAPPQPPAAPDLVRIDRAAAAQAVPEWEAMSAQDRSLHLQAQRFARVQVAEMRLYQAAAVQAGRAHGDLYSALQESIDAAREAFRQSFLSANPRLTDYLHQELLHTLADDHPAWLGENYPGPLV